MKKRSYLKQAICVILITCMTLGIFQADTYTGTLKNPQNEVQEPAISLEKGKTYSLPLVFFNRYNEPEEINVFELSNFIDNVAMLRKNDDGTYKITIQIDNFNKIDIFQILKQGAADPATQANDILLGTFNIPDSYICNPDQNRAKYPDNPVNEATIQLKENGFMDESWNDRYIQNAEIKMGELGVAYYSFTIDNLTDLIYVKCFRSYGRTSSKASYGTAVQSGKIQLDYNNISEVKEINSSNYASVQGELSRVAVKTDHGVINPGGNAKANQLLKDQVTANVSGESVSAVFTMKESDKTKSVRQLTEIYDIGERSAYPTDSNYRRYANAYSKLRSGKSGLSIYSDNMLNAGSQFTITYNSIEEVVFGKKIMISLDDESAYFAQLRIHTQPKEAIEIHDGDLTLVSDTYALNKKVAFSTNKLEATTDENSEYNLLYSMLAGSSQYCLLYKPELLLNGGKAIPNKNVEIRFRIPDGWDTDKIKLYRLNGTWQEGSMNEVSSYGDQSEYTIEGNVCVLSTSCVNGTYALTQEAAQTNIGALLDGIYKVNVTLWQLEDRTKLSMSNSAIASDSARLFVSGNGSKKQLYFDMQGITIAGKYGYANRVFQSENTQTESDGLPVLSSYEELEYYSYFTDDKGSFTMDDYAKTYGLSYPKTVGYELPASADKDNGVYMKFYVPVMDELQGAVPGSGDGNRVAFMTLSSAQKIAEENVPVHDKTVLLLALQEAGKYEKGNYTTASYQKLTDAIKAANAILEDEAADGDSIDIQINALREAIGQLVPLSHQSADKEELRKAIQLASAIQNPNLYTESSWNSFQEVLSLARKIAEDEDAVQSVVDRQTALLKAAADALVSKEQDGVLHPGTYETSVSMLNAASESVSMGNASLHQTGTVIVSEDGTIKLQLRFVPMNYLGTQGYLFKFAKVDMNSVKYNDFHYPVSYQTMDATVLEKYDVYDMFNDKNSKYYDANTGGGMYPKLLSVPVVRNESLFYVEVYVPVMESIGSGQGTKLARLSIDWAKMKQISGIARDDSVLRALIEQVAGIKEDGISKELYSILQLARLSAEKILEDMNATQAEIDAQFTILQQALDAAIQRSVDKTSLAAIIEESQKYVNQKETYTAESLKVLIEAIQNANKVMESNKATQAEVTVQIKALETAIKGLREKTNVDKRELKSLLDRAFLVAGQKDMYTEESVKLLLSAIQSADKIMDNESAGQAEVTAAIQSVQAALDRLVKKTLVDKTDLLAKIREAQAYLSQTSVYTADSLAALHAAVKDAVKVYDDSNAVLSVVDRQLHILNSAIEGLAKLGSKELDIYHLNDGVYVIHGIMVKVDKKTASMSDEAIHHAVKLTVKDGKYYITLDFKGLTISNQLGYLSQLDYYLSGYTLDQYGNPVGDTARATVNEYQKYPDGTVVNDSYGTNYPDIVTFELIPEALKDGYVPLQVLVPVMEAISKGAGTQPVFLKLDWTSLESTTEDDPDFTKGDNLNHDKKEGGNKGKSILDMTSTLNKKSGITGADSQTNTYAAENAVSRETNFAGQKSGGVQTGDRAPAGIWMILLLASSALIAVQIKTKRYTDNI